MNRTRILTGLGTAALMSLFGGRPSSGRIRTTKTIEQLKGDADRYKWNKEVEAKKRAKRERKLDRDMKAKGWIR
jgi:hypothetical protein